MDLEQRLEKLGRSLAEREAGHADALAAAGRRAAALHARVATALERFHEAVLTVAPQLEITLGDPRIDDKHLHAVEFELRRGRYRAVVTVKSRGQVTLVGPFREGKTEGPCRSFSFDADGELELALGDFLTEFVEKAATP